VTDGIASLPMYDLPEIRGATDRYWGLIRAALADAGIAAPVALNRTEAYHAPWTDPELILSQTCGFPLRTALKGRVTLVATPDFGLPGLPPGHYCSVVVARADDPRDSRALQGARLALNGFDSQSGWAAPQNAAVAEGGGFARFEETGAHAASLDAVREGRADVAACDAVTWRLLSRHRPAATAGLRVVTETPPTPGLPYITALGRDPAPIARALAKAVAALQPGDRADMGLVGIVAIPEAAYRAVPVPARPAQNGRTS
jgi:ABC-type phosphate/phosphonate transport system substrate-binding protein